jgi:hypothetical protein
MHIRIRKGDFFTFLVEAKNGQSLLVQIDWDFSDLAASFGWTACECGETDETVDCPHRTASDMQRPAGSWRTTKARSRTIPVISERRVR